jgi:hypothetical protein
MSKVSGACLMKSSLRIPHVVAWLGISFMRILLVSKGAWEYLPKHFCMQKYMQVVMYPLLFDFNQNWHVAINFSKSSQYQNENLFSHP